MAGESGGFDSRRGGKAAKSRPFGGEIMYSVDITPHRTTKTAASTDDLRLWYLICRPFGGELMYSVDITLHRLPHAVREFAE